MPRPPGRTGRHSRPARALRGPKRRAKTDRADAHHLRELLRAGSLPESWIPPAHIADARTQVRLRHALAGQRTAWQQRIHSASTRCCSTTACPTGPTC
jgi:transposase